MTDDTITLPVILRETTEALSRSGRDIAIISLAGALVSVLVAHGLDVAWAGAGAAEEGLGRWTLFYVGMFWGALVNAFQNAAIAHLVVARKKTHVPTLGEATARALRRMPTVFATMFAVSIVVGCALLGFILPGLYWAARLSVAVPAATMLDGGPGEAMSRSSELTRPQVALILLLGVLLIVVSVALYGVASFVESAISGESIFAAFALILNAASAHALALSVMVQAASIALSATLLAATYRRLARKPRSLGKELARVFR